MPLPKISGEVFTTIAVRLDDASSFVISALWASVPHHKTICPAPAHTLLYFSIPAQQFSKSLIKLVPVDGTPRCQFGTGLLSIVCGSTDGEGFANRIDPPYFSSVG